MASPVTVLETSPDISTFVNNNTLVHRRKPGHDRLSNKKKHKVVGTWR